MKQLALLVILFAIVQVALSANFISNALGSHMVLQRAPEKANIWGWTKPADTVKVTFNNKEYTATAAATTGFWNVLLDAMEAGGPYDIKATSSSGVNATLADVLFGDVFLCGGQSNMQFGVASAFNATAEIAAANNYPHIRLFTVGSNTYSATPLDEFKTISQPWSVASSSSIPNFSAVCWFFGRDLYNDLKVPLGLVNDNWGGTPVQSWSSPEALTKCKAQNNKLIAQEKQAFIVGDGPNDPSVLWNSMIVPVLHMTIKGVTWYQGEANSGQPNYYACAFPAMIVDWRLKWGGNTNKEFGFFFVQLAPWSNNSDDVAEALTRLAQMYATVLPNVGMTTAMDWGDPTSPFGDIHPRYKQIVGYRLQLAARGILYGEKIQYKGPEASGFEVVRQAPAARVRVNFKPETIGSGLMFVSKSCDAGIPTKQCAWYDIGTSAGKWINATATTDGKSVMLAADVPAGETVTGCRYAFGNYPVATLYNKEGLPALPWVFPNPIKPTL